MSRKHNCPKRGRRSKSRYPQRLAARGLKPRDVAMEDAETLRARQSRRGDLPPLDVPDLITSAPKQGRRP